MPSAWLTNFMAQLESSQTERQPNAQEIAADIIRRSNRYRYDIPKTRSGLMAQSVGKAGSSPTKQGPSTIQRVIDLISRPLYGTANAYKERVKEDLADDNKISIGERIGYLVDPLNLGGGTEPYKAFGRGFTGKDKTTFADVLEKSDPNMGKKTKFAVGLGLDIFADPSTYVPGGAILKFFGRGGKEVVEQAAETAAEKVERVYGAAQYGAKNRKPRDLFGDKTREARMAPEGTIFRPEAPKERLALPVGKWRDPNPVMSRAKNVGDYRTSGMRATRPIDLGGGAVKSVLQIPLLQL